MIAAERALSAGRSRLPLAPTLGARSWSLIALCHAGILALSASMVFDELSSADRGQFLVSRVIGSASFVGGAWLLVHALDRVQALGHTAWRVIARVTAIHLIAAFTMAVAVPLVLLSEWTLDWSVARTRADYTTQFEVNVIVFSVYGMLYWGRRRHIISEVSLKRAAQADLAWRDARLHALALELQPHFLHNALNGIAQLVHEDPAQAEAMLVKLGDMLRATLHNGGVVEHTVSDELAQLSLYLELQRMRFGDRLHVAMDVSPDAHHARIPVMVLQPLVENALHHGIGKRPGPGTLALHVDVMGSAHARRLMLRVSDDGAGLGDSLIREGIGLRNTRDRLDMLYAESSTFSLQSGPQGGAVATIELPWRPAAATTASIA